MFTFPLICLSWTAPSMAGQVPGGQTVPASLTIIDPANNTYHLLGFRGLKSDIIAEAYNKGEFPNHDQGGGSEYGPGIYMTNTLEVAKEYSDGKYICAIYMKQTKNPPKFGRVVRTDVSIMNPWNTEGACIARAHPNWILVAPLNHEDEQQILFPPNNPMQWSLLWAFCHSPDRIFKAYSVVAQNFRYFGPAKDFFWFDKYVDIPSEA